MAILKPVDTAIVVQIGPLISASDGKTALTGVAYNAAGMSVVAHKVGVNSGSSALSITPTTSGSNDWTEGAGGYYYLELTAAQNDTEGSLQITGKVDASLPFESLAYQVVPLSVYNTLVAGSSSFPTYVQLAAGSAVNVIDAQTNVTIHQHAASPSVVFPAATDSSGNAITLDGTLTLNVYSGSHAETLLFDLTSAAGELVVSGTDSNIVTATYSGTESATDGTYRYELWHNHGTSTARVLYAGAWVIVDTYTV